MLLAIHPDIPSPRLERLEGYDVRFKLNIGKRNYSVFYQQKISNYNEKLHGPNRRFYECHEAPYFRFQLTNHQHNILHELSQDCTDVYYSAQIFHERDVLADYADNGTIINRACLQSPFQARKAARFCVIPGGAERRPGIQKQKDHWIPVFAGMTTVVLHFLPECKHDLVGLVI